MNPVLIMYDPKNFITCEKMLFVKKTENDKNELNIQEERQMETFHSF